MQFLPALFVFFASSAAAADSYVAAAFANHSGDAKLDWIGESIAEGVREALQAAGVASIKREEQEEVARKLSLRPGSPHSLAATVKVAEQLGAAFIVTGKFELAPPALPQPAPSRGTLRVAARLIDRRQGAEIAEIFESSPLEDLATLQREISWRVLIRIKPGGAPSREEFDRRHPPIKVTALENYTRGLISQTDEQRHRYFTQAARLDASFQRPAFYLGRMHWNKENYANAIPWLERITPDSAEFNEALFLLALSHYHNSDFEAALRHFETLGARVPAPEIINNIGAVQLETDTDAALARFRHALKTNPGDPDYLFNSAYALWRKGEFEAAASGFRAVLDRTPDDADALHLLGRCLKKSGPRAGDLRSEGLQRLKEEWGDWLARTPCP
jgi:tetratricopeptide (TPR) repeat protein